MSTPVDAPKAEYQTPTKRTTFSTSSEAGPSRARPSGGSPAYSSRRHSLYGIEDRIVIDPGSRVWKVGFSGEADPRAVLWAQDDPDDTGGAVWELDLRRISGVREDRDEVSRVIAARVKQKLRETFIKHLMTDSKARKVIVIENTFLPNLVKERIAEALFENLQVPSVSFTSSSLLALVACGRVTGLVVDCGWLETTVTPVYHSRPLLHLARTTHLAGRALHSRLRTLLRYHATYVSPPSSLGSIRDRKQITPIPRFILGDRMVERVLTKGCFVDGPLPVDSDGEEVAVDESQASENQEDDKRRMSSSLRTRYAPFSTATDLSFRVPPEPGATKDIGFGTLLVPGWIRQRAAEVLFEENDEDEAEVLPDAILGCLLKLPVDIRSPLASSILVTGGTASLPGFIPRLRNSLIRRLTPSNHPTSSVDGLPPSAARQAETKAWRNRHTEPYKALYRLSKKTAILNDPAPLDGEGGSAGGKPPRWVPSLMSWIGGSLAGALQTGGSELLREDYDALCADAMDRADAYRTVMDVAEAEVAALVGLDVEELLPGMALEGMDGKRKRGYREGPQLSDWTHGAVKAG